MRLWLLPFILFLTSCQAFQSYEERFANIKIGMVKSEVIDVAGPPRWSDRKKGQDRWIYFINAEDHNTERVVYFENGKVIKKGLREKPAISAEDMDRVNEGKQTDIKVKPRMSDEEL